MDSYIIQVRPQDELTAIVDKIINTEAQRVYLLITEQSHIAQHVLNLRLLKREADSMGKEIVVVSASPRVQALALKASLQVHQETDELKQSAEKDTAKGDSFLGTPMLRDIVAPQSSGIPKTPKNKKSKSVPETAPPLPQIPRLEDKQPSAEISKEGAIANFWTKKRPSLPSARAFPLLPSKTIFSYFKFSFNNTRIFKYFLLPFVVASFVVAGLTFYSILPKAKVYITPFVEDVVLEIQMKGDANISKIQEVKFVIPAQIFEKSVASSRNITTSGEKELNEKARGVIKIYNAFSSAPQTLVETTRFVSEDGELFRTTETIVVPGAEVEGGRIVSSFTTVNVIAAEAGESYNIGPSSFSIPGFKGTSKYLAFYGKSESEMEGGRIGLVKVVSEGDYKNIKEDIEAELESRVAQELELSIQEGFIIPPGASKMSEIEITSSSNIGEEAEELMTSGSVSLRAFAIRGADVLQLLESDFAKRFPGKKLIPNGEEIVYKVIGTDFDGGILDLKISYSARAAKEVSSEEIKEGISGKEERDVRVFLSSHPGVKEARVTFWPFWVHRIPNDPSKIEVVIEP